MMWRHQYLLLLTLHWLLVLLLLNHLNLLLGGVRLGRGLGLSQEQGPRWRLHLLCLVQQQLLRWRLLLLLCRMVQLLLEHLRLMLRRLGVGVGLQLGRHVCLVPGRAAGRVYRGQRHARADGDHGGRGAVVRRHRHHVSWRRRPYMRGHVPCCHV